MNLLSILLSLEHNLSTVECRKKAKTKLTYVCQQGFSLSISSKRESGFETPLGRLLGMKNGDKLCKICYSASIKC